MGKENIWAPKMKRYAIPDIHGRLETIGIIMTRLSPEREKEIRQDWLSKKDYRDDLECRESAQTDIPELLAEIDALREEVIRLTENNATLRHEFKMAQASMPEVKELREQVEKYRTVLRKILSEALFYHYSETIAEAEELLGGENK